MLTNFAFCFRAKSQLWQELEDLQPQIIPSGEKWQLHKPSFSSKHSQLFSDVSQLKKSCSLQTNPSSGGRNSVRGWFAHLLLQLDHFLVLLLLPLPEFLSVLFHLTHQLHPLLLHFLKNTSGWRNYPGFTS